MVDIVDQLLVDFNSYYEATPFYGKNQDHAEADENSCDGNEPNYFEKVQVLQIDLWSYAYINHLC